MLLLPVLVSPASAQTYLDRFGAPPRPATPVSTGPAWIWFVETEPYQPPPTDAVVLVDEQLAPVAEAEAVEEPTWAVFREAPVVSTTSLPSSPQADAVGPARSPVGPSVELALTAASAYAYRGANLYGSDLRQSAGLVAPSVAAAFGSVELGWSTAVQATGDHFAARVDQGVADEQNLWVTVARESAGLALEAGLVGTTFPFADLAVTGVAWPTTIEPWFGVATALRGPELAVRFSYLRGLQRGLVLGDHAYLSAGVSHAVPVTAEGLSVVMGVSGGAKLWAVDPTQRDNVFDADLWWGVDLVESAVGLSPAVHLSWTDLEDSPVGGETFVWVALVNSVAL